jgi:hypothetical protein
MQDQRYEKFVDEYNKIKIQKQEAENFGLGIYDG